MKTPNRTLPDEIGRPDDGEVLGRHARLGGVGGDAVQVQHQVVQRPGEGESRHWILGTVARHTNTGRAIGDPKLLFYKVKFQERPPVFFSRYSHVLGHSHRRRRYHPHGKQNLTAMYNFYPTMAPPGLGNIFLWRLLLHFLP